MSEDIESLKRVLMKMKGEARGMRKSKLQNRLNPMDEKPPGPPPIGDEPVDPGEEAAELPIETAVSPIETAEPAEETPEEAASKLEEIRALLARS